MQEEEKMKEEADKIDDEENKKEEEVIKKLAKTSFMKKLAPYNKPCITAFIGLVTSLIQGTLFPVFGLLMGKMLFVWMIPDLNELRQ